MLRARKQGVEHSGGSEMSRRRQIHDDRMSGLPVVSSMLPQRVSDTCDCSFTATYDPDVVDELLAKLASVPQDITICSGDLMFLGSPRSRLVLNYREKKFRGYLSEFKPSDASDEEPTMTATVSIIQ